MAVDTSIKKINYNNDNKDNDNDLGTSNNKICLY